MLKIGGCCGNVDEDDEGIDNSDDGHSPPTVASLCSGNCPRTNLRAKLDLPTPWSPNNTSLACIIRALPPGPPPPPDPDPLLGCPRPGPWLMLKESGKVEWLENMKRVLHLSALRPTPGMFGLPWCYTNFGCCLSNGQLLRD
ncbi:hypothetical protein RRG08_001828 [Elysia crispata]|uniref:Uncharacterized protein n=1 Tax=Elysia crispata TaxID=231223 RepID=A0AAE0Y8M3_9GAST|nr:hypothetical protein RRG08_001828 [Elysia crispata]